MTTARWAGVTYLFLIVTGIFSIAFAPGQYMVDGDAAATFAKLEANSLTFTNATVAELACQSSFVLLAALLHRVFRPWSEVLGLTMVGFVLVSVPISFIAIGEKLSIIQLLVEGAADAEIVDAHLRKYADIRNLAELFWGLWLLPYGLLVLKSRAIPRLFGVALILGCCAYVAGVFIPFYWDGYWDSPIGQFAGIPGAIGEIGGALWLTAFGARTFAPDQEPRP
jgi:Domain of unknown function (DUF4386)